jgi:hypothetical protein
MLALTAAIVLLGVGVMLVIGGRIIEDRTDDRITEINKDFDASLDRFQEDVKKELDARAGSLGTAIPTVTAVPTPTVSPEGADSTPTPTATATPSAEASPTATPTTEIRP